MKKDSINYARLQGGERDTKQHDSTPEITAQNFEAKAAEEASLAAKQAELGWLREQVVKAVPIEGTPAELYMTAARKLSGPYPDSLKWAPNYQANPKARFRPCLLSIVTNSQGEIVAAQSLELDPATGKKAKLEKPDRYSNGCIGEGTVKLSNSVERSTVLVIGEGMETVLSRCQIGPCDAHACLGPLRYIPPSSHHKIIQILADNNGRDAARTLAREYAKQAFQAFVITVPDIVGEKADLNDMLREQGIKAVQIAVEDAEKITSHEAAKRQNYDLKIGSDPEIGRQVLEKAEAIYGPMVVTEGKLWRYGSTHWKVFEIDQLKRLIYQADGATYTTPSGNLGIVKLTKGKVDSILDIMLKSRQQEEFFGETTTAGINCSNGFVSIDMHGEAELKPHARQWRQRHIVLGKWNGQNDYNLPEDSLLNRYFAAAFQNETDKEARITLMSEILGCTALGYGTKIGSAKAIVLFSEQGGTGKSTFLNIARGLPNPEAVASVPASKLSDEKFAHRLIGKVLNAVDELPNKAIKSDMFKRTITGEPIPARDLYCSATDFRPQALHLFSTNVLPAFTGGADGGIERRLLPVEFKQVVREGERDEKLPAKILADADTLLNFAVAGACRLVKLNAFSVPESSKILLVEWLKTVDPVRGWVNDKLEITEDVGRLTFEALYNSFINYCRGIGVKEQFIIGAVAFGKRLRIAAPALRSHRSDGTHFENARLRR